LEGLLACEIAKGGPDKVYLQQENKQYGAKGRTKAEQDMRRMKICDTSTTGLK
jgi:hypothetical protein